MFQTILNVWLIFRCFTFLYWNTNLSFLNTTFLKLWKNANYNSKEFAIEACKVILYLLYILEDRNQWLKKSFVIPSSRTKILVRLTKSLQDLIVDLHFTWFGIFVGNLSKIESISIYISLIVKLAFPNLVLKLPSWARVLIPLILESNSLTALFNSGRIRCFDPAKSWRMLAVWGDWDVITGYNCSVNLDTHSIVWRNK